ncbi:MAG: hypothetical protein HS111_02015 [Kofleriaceae bacterium]|nr:hypothetical protein [Kofleriaceae bacterium]
MVARHAAVGEAVHARVTACTDAARLLRLIGEVAAAPDAAAVERLLAEL